ncbi:MAG: hypothetical protein A2Y66_01755 [Nitrospirae bacterium RBG_13_41_22]|nr:MAG: hypothetical protein A2Y66_01755 [Nitrospirae bacterium RBG_13_41_22]
MPINQNEITWDDDITLESPDISEITWDDENVIEKESSSKILGTGKSIAKQVLRFGPNISKTMWQGLGFAGGTLESTMKTGKEITGDFMGAFSPWERIGKNVREYGLRQADQVKKALEHPFFNLPEEKRGKLWDNPQYMLDPEWMVYNAGEAIQSLGLVIGATVYGGPTAGMAVGGGMEGLDFYDDLLDEGVNPDNAASGAIAFGIVTGILNKVGADKVMKRLTGTLVKRAGRRVVAGTTEAGTEWAEEPFQAAFSVLSKGGNIGDASQSALEAMKNIDVIPGAFITGGLLAGSGTSNNKNRSTDKDNIITAIKEDFDKGELNAQIVEELKKAFPGISEEIDKIVGESFAESVADAKSEVNPELKAAKEEVLKQKKQEIVDNEIKKVSTEQKNQEVIYTLGTRSGLPYEQVSPVKAEKIESPEKMPSLKELLNKETLTEQEISHLVRKKGKSKAWDTRINNKLQEIADKNKPVEETPKIEPIKVQRSSEEAGDMTQYEIVEGENKGSSVTRGTLTQTPEKYAVDETLMPAVEAKAKTGDTDILAKDLERLKAAKAKTEIAPEVTEEPIKKAEKPVLATEQISTKIIRLEEENAEPDFNKPQGLYTTPAENKTLIEGMEGKKYEYNFKPNKPFKVTEELYVEHARGKGLSIPASSGIKALKEQVGDNEFNRLMKLNKKQLIDELSTKMPDIKWEKYYDAYEILEGYSGKLLKDKGYDSIIGDKDEVVILDKSILSPAKEEGKEEPWEMTQDAIKKAEPIIGLDYSNTEIENIPQVGDEFDYEFDGKKADAKIIKINTYPDGKEFIVEKTTKYALPGTKSAKNIKTKYTINDIIRHGYHKNLVQQALSEGKPVPEEVLKDYPDLMKGDQDKETGAREKGESVDDWLNRITGQSPLTKKERKIKDLRLQADNIAKEADKMLERIPAGQPIHSTKDRNLRERSGEKMRKASELYKQADKLEADLTPKAEEKAKESKEVIAKDKEKGKEYEYKIGKHSDKDITNKPYIVQFKDVESDTWENGNFGYFGSKEEARKKFPERYVRNGGNIDSIQVLDDRLKGYVDKEISAKKGRLQQEKESNLKKQEEEIQNQKDRAEREEFIASIKNEKLQGKKGTVNIALREGGTETKDATIYGDYAIIKEDAYKGNNYNITHVATGMGVHTESSFTNAQNIAKAFNKYIKVDKNTIGNDEITIKAGQLLRVFTHNWNVPDFIKTSESTPQSTQEETNANTPGMVRLDKGGVKPFVSMREFKTGKNKTSVTGKVEVTLADGKKIKVNKDQIRKMPEVDQKVEDAKKRIKDSLNNEKGALSNEDSTLKDDLITVGRHYYNQGYQKLESFTAQMKTTFSEVWDKIKNVIKQIYEHVKSKLSEERGSIPLEGKKKPKGLLSEYEEIKQSTKILKEGPKDEKIIPNAKNIIKQAEGYLGRRFGKGFKDRDMKLFNRIYTLPYWAAKEYESMAQLVGHEIDAQEKRSTELYKDYNDTELGKIQSEIPKNKKEYKELKDVIWKYEGKRFSKTEVPTDWHKEIKEGEDIEINPKHYEEVDKYLEKQGASNNVRKAFIAIRKILDAKYVDIDKTMRIEKLDPTLIEEYRGQIGKINNYFPHRRQGDTFITIVDTEEKDPEKRTVYREHYYTGFPYLKERLTPINKKATARAQKWLEQAVKNGQLPKDISKYKISQPDKVTQLPDEVFFNIPIEAMQQILSVAGTSLADARVKYEAERLYNKEDKTEDEALELAKKRLHADMEKALSVAVSDVLKSRGFGRHAIMRKGIPGHETEDIFGILFDYLSGYAGFKTKIERAKAHHKTLTEIDAKKNPNEYKYASKYVRDALANHDKVDRIVDGLRAIFYVKFLGFVPKSALVNLTQNLVLAAPTLSVHIKSGNGVFKAERLIGKAMKDTRRAVTSKAAWTQKGEIKYPGLKQNEQQALKELVESGASMDLFLRELQGNLPEIGWSKYFDKVIKKAGIFMQIAEKWNRTSTGLAAYRLAYNKGVKGNTKGNHEASVKFAKQIIYDSHFLYGKANLPELIRGGDVQKVLRAGYTFRSFTHNYLSAIAHLLKNQPGGGKAVARSLRNLFLVGGLTSIPFFKAFSEALLWALDKDDEDVFTKVRGVLPNQWTRDIVTYGLPGVAGVDFTGSLSIEVPTGWKDLIGVPYSFIEDTMNTTESLKSGAGWKALSETPFTPLSARNAMRGIELYTTGQRTRGGKDINYPGQPGPRKITGMEALGKSLLGLQPVSVSKGYGSYKANQQVQEYVKNKKQKFVDRYINAFKDEDQEKMQKIIGEVNKHNEQVVREGKPYLQIYIFDAVKNRLRPSIQSIPKNLRNKALEISETWQ